MKKKVNHCLSFLLLCIGLYACSNRSQKEQTISQADSMRVVIDNPAKSENFPASDSLSPDELNAFGKRAVQKLEDYTNCLQIINNKAYDSTMRNRAKIVAAEFFLNKDRMFQAISSYTPGAVDSAELNIQAVGIKPSSIIRRDSIYEGQLEYKIIMPGKSSNKFYFRFEILRRIRAFGNNQKRVWEVYLDPEGIYL